MFARITTVSALLAVGIGAIVAQPGQCNGGKCGECTYDTPWKSGINGVYDGGRCVRCSGSLPGQ